MTRQPFEIAARLRDAAVRTGTLLGELQHGSWFGAPPATEEIANLGRAAVCLNDAAEELAGEALPNRSTTIILCLRAGLSVVVTAAVLVAVPDPARPEFVVGAVLTSWVVDEIMRRIVLTVEFRRRIAKPSAPPRVPVEKRIGQIHADVDALLPSVEDWEDVADDVRGALYWLDRA